ncbi:oxidoreductase AflX [Diplogelasinospora grovesii]|uniref:Oxidoreductase AflX n=1 Tax=Diplogelasinospora grovesii TaxID=303347 RepID=A0AAN6N7P8_9PEZI|nr:oxidoreductase AflX [Diplogelasinospora grovesii]
MPQPKKTILFLGATGGCAFSALRRSLAANHTCIALCRTPSKLTSKLTPAEQSSPNLHIEPGNAHDIDALMRALLLPTPNSPPLVDTIISSIGAAPTLSLTGGIALDDPHACGTGMTALLTALRRCRDEKGAVGDPRIVAVSTTGISDSGRRDVPLLMVPLYHVLLREPHKDKKAMERALVASGERRWTVVRASLLTDGPGVEDGGRVRVRVGVEDLVVGGKEGVKSLAVGYTIAREDVGRWIFENLIQEDGEGGGGRWDGKAVTVTY